ncbi:gamma-glutamyltransferase [Psychromonas sp. psych-6C06]|uniref:gamma-glutamyltransferase n=1 Tax=Psychromonas sp. psych-6C06 TaxID=2058089 RepID=UPI000C339169|nr:gamma-glutamyltransferase [Psychromonas sp. psych-6C06]PKF62697.1 gamma-glutamyltransferase [Psychromonas sp. psych-6C06]
MRTLIVILLLGSLLATATHATPPPTPQQTAIYSNNEIHHPVWAKNAMVATQEALATQIGVDILQQGGNAVDAAVAVGYALAVTLPRAGNLGGGGFMLVYLNKQQKAIAIDYREKAPAAATRNMYLDENGDAQTELSRFHGLAVGVPGTVMGLEFARKKYGTLSREQLIKPAIKLASEGVLVSPDLANSLNQAKPRLSKWSSSKDIFYKQDGESYQVGERLRQTDLAATLRLISTQGESAFYQGEVAKQISKSVQQAGGLITVEDMKNYRAIEREAVKGDYRGYQVLSMPPPSSGGIHIVQLLNMLEHYPLTDYGHNSAQSIHIMSETMRRAYADRARYLGDSDFVKVPIKQLTSKQYAQQRIKDINLEYATDSNSISAGKVAPYESDQTTHFSIVDRWGNAVSNTYTLNFSYGMGMVAQGTGVLLNNEMDDFSAKPGEPNGYGLIGGEANAIQANKRPLSSMSPTIILKDRQPFLVTGTPGGSRIITTTLQVIVNVIDHEMNIAQATASPRFHHQWLPDYIRYEQGVSIDTIKLLKAKGHKLKQQTTMGSTQTIMRLKDSLLGASDPRTPSALSLGY